jgi:23S rRNA (guanosine2251-2'-O)-methyltransferase
MKKQLNQRFKSKKLQKSQSQHSNQSNKNYKTNNLSRDYNEIEKDFIWIGGKNPCFLALKNQKRKIFEIIVNKNNLEDLKFFFDKNSLQHLEKIVRVHENVFFQNIFHKDFVHQGIAIRASKIEFKTQFDLLEEINLIEDKNHLPDILILDQITDPQNVGAIIRSAVAFNFKKIVFCEFNSAKETASLVKASAGNIDFAEIFVATNINNLIEKLKKIGYWCIGLAGEGVENEKKIAEYKNIVLVVGSEGAGMRNLVKKNCDLLVRINTNKEVESLNVSVATAIALNEIYRNKNV